MADPISGGIGKATQQMVQELQKQAQEVAQGEGAGGPDKAQFNMDVNKVEQVQDTQKVNETKKATDVLRTAHNNAVNGADQARWGVKPVDGAKKKSAIARVLEQVVEGQDKLDDIIKMAMNGKQYGQQELLAIQASVYKFSQELDLTSKVVEKATSGVKQTMQTQV